MDLNFADPPIPPDWSAFEPRIRPEDAADVLAGVAAAMRTNEVLHATFEEEEIIETAAAALEDPDVTGIYARGVPMIARFLTIELDTEHKIGKGIGRLTPRDPPPRFGAKYRKNLRDPAVADEMGSVLENLALHGFAAMAALNAVSDPPPDRPSADPLPERWAPLVRNLTPTMHDLVDKLQMDPETASGSGLMIFGVAQPAADDYVLLAEKLRLGKRRPFGAARMVSYMHLFLALGLLVFDTGVDRAPGVADFP
jgi:hypothetical protein